MTKLADWQPHIDQNRCTGCGDCITQCPTDALSWQDGSATLLRPHACLYCATCEDICPTNAIELPFLIIRESRQT